MESDAPFTLALPNKGRLEKPTLEFLSRCGLRVPRPNERQYESRIAEEPSVRVVWQRAGDIPDKVAEGNFTLGITGYDLVKENFPEGESSKVAVIVEDLRYGDCRVVLAVPEYWVDVTSVRDLAELALLWRDKGKQLRVATDFANLTTRYLIRNGVTNFVIVESKGATEIAPRMGFADIVADITSSGTTLSENRLKEIDKGTVLESAACLIGNWSQLKAAIKGDSESGRTARKLVEHVEAALRASEYRLVVANVEGDNWRTVGRRLSERGLNSTAGMNGTPLFGMRGPTVCPVYDSEVPDGVYAVQVVVNVRDLMDTVQYLRRQVKGADILVFPIDFVFNKQSWSWERLAAAATGETVGQEE